MKTRLLQKAFLILGMPALILGVSLGLLELLLSWGSPPIEDWWVRDEDRLRPAEHGPVAGTIFRETHIPVAREPAMVRIVCLGGSTTYGHPFDPPGAFSDWLAVRLPRLVPGRHFEIFNIGSNGFNIEAVRDLARCLWDAEPDWLVIATGHNEFLAPHLETLRSPLTHRLRRWSRGTELGRRWRAWASPDAEAGRDLLARRQIAVHDGPFLRDHEIQRGHRRFASIVEQLVAEARGRGVNVVLCHPVSDALDTPPQHSSFSTTTSAADRERLQSWIEELDPQLRALPGLGPGAGGPDLEPVLDRLEAILALDSAIARAWWWKGRVLHALGRESEAREALDEARERDGHPIRATRAVHDALSRLAGDDVLLADPRPLFDEVAHGIPGQASLFVDYCHPTLLGHQWIAESILRAWAADGAWNGSWGFAQEPSIAEYAATMGLDPAAQASNLARRALAALASAYFQPDGDRALAAARELLDLALDTDPDCALAHAGLGFVRCAEGRGEEALRALRQAERLDPATLGPLAEAWSQNPAVREVFVTAGVGFDGMRPIKWP